MIKAGLIAFAILVSLGLGSGVGVARAQTPFEAQVAVVPGQLIIGDVVRVTASVNHPAGYTLGPLELEGMWGPFEIRGLGAPVTVANGDGSETTSITFDAQVFELGQLATPALTLTVISPTGAESLATAGPISVSVESVAQDADLRDIRPQTSLPGPKTGLIVGAILAGLAAVVVAFVAYRYLVRPRTQGSPGIAADWLPPYERAISELARIEALELTKEKRFKEHYVLVSDVARRYLDAELHLDVLESTTAEVSRQIRESPVPWKLGHRVLTVLFVSDLVKFARYRPSSEEADALIPDARTLINDLHREAGRAVPEGASFADADRVDAR